MAEWHEKFSQICKMPHSEQGIWFLNGYWESLGDQAEARAEEIWKMVHQFIEVQLDKPLLYGRKMIEFEEGCDLDEFKSHRILELMGGAVTVVELRKRLKKLDLDSNKRMCIMELLVDKYEKTPEEICTLPQGSVAPEELAKAQSACDSASEAMNKASADAEAAAKAVEDSKKASADSAEAKIAADQALDAARGAEEAVKNAEAELQASIEEMKALEQAKADKLEKCQKIIDDPEISTVKKGKAVQERDATLAEDPLPLRKAKITQTAALKKVTKAREAAEVSTKQSHDASEAAAQAKTDAEAAEVAAHDAKEVADAAKVAAAEAEKEAHGALEALKAKGGSPFGKLWWMDRILAEKKKFMKR